MTTHQARLQGREAIANGTMAFHFEKPPGFTFKPGQAIDVVLARSAGRRRAEHAPHLLDRQRAFRERADRRHAHARQRLQACARLAAVGSPFAIDGPSGSLTLHNDRARPAVFIAGGIGITPFMSMLRQAAKDQVAATPGAALLQSPTRRRRISGGSCSSSTSEPKLPAGRDDDADERLEPRWDGPTGLIDEPLLKSVAGDLSAPIYYVAGPPGLVETMRQTLNGAGVDDDDIRSEEFYGY